MKRLLLSAAAAALVAAVSAVSLGPATDARAEGRWRFTFERGDFGALVAGGGPHYYLRYKVKNTTGEDRKPRIRLEVQTDTGRSHGDHYDGPTYRAVAKKAGKTRIDSTLRMRVRDLPDGETAEAMAQFGRIDPNSDKFEVRVYGLWDPIVRDREGVVWSERRVLVLKYERSGDEYGRWADPIRFVSKKEEVEGKPVKLYATRPER